MANYYDAEASEKNVIAGEDYTVAHFLVAADDLLEAVTKMTQTEVSLLENRRYADLEDLEITIVVRRSKYTGTVI